MHNEPTQLLQYDNVKKVAEQLDIDVFWKEVKRMPNMVGTGTDVIAKDSNLSFMYAMYGVRGRFEEGETAIAKSPSNSFEYAKEILKGRFPEGEDAIGSEGLYALQYARDTMKGRFPKGEDEIARAPIRAFLYARIMKDRFPKGEETLKKHNEFWGKYVKMLATNGIEI